VVDELRSVVAESRRLTVLIFTDGSGTFTNTPFDEALNAAVAANQPGLAKTRMPLVIVLRSEQGKLIGHNVSLAPWPVEFPPFTPEPAPVVATAPRPEPPPTNRPPREIHISAKPKPEPVVIAITTNAPTTTNPPVTAIIVEPAPVFVVRPGPAPATGAGAVESAANPAPETNVIAAASPTVPPPALAPTITAPPAPAPASAPPVAAQPSPSPTPVPAAAVALAEPDVTTGVIPARSRWPLYAGIGCMSTAGLIAVVLALRSRRARGSSLITRSFDRQ
jgi:hypothetical protein